MTYCVIRTHVHCEKIAIENLKRQDFNYYQPLILERKKRRNKLQYVESPLFPCYLFVEIIDKWRSLQNTYGVAGLVGSKSSPAFVRDAVIQSLRNREQNGFIQLPKARAFNVGDKVMINNGSFAGQEALVERMSGNQRQKILLALLANRINVLVDEEDLLAA